ncbi:MAG: hypothetical protein AB1705_18410 [Verrucomicrobiota bacterium]
MKSLRRAHLYLGCFFAPMLLFYILTGWYQTINPDRLKSPSEAETVLQKLRTVHVDQIYPGAEEFDKPSSPKLYRALAVIMCLAATVTIVLGLVLAFQTLKSKWPVWVSLVLGILLPVLMLWLGQGR